MQATVAQPRGCEGRGIGMRSGKHRVDVALVLRRGSTREGQRRGAQVEVKQAIAETRLVVVVALGLRGGDNLDLAAVEAEAFVDRANLRLGRLRVRQEDAALGALGDGPRGGPKPCVCGGPPGGEGAGGVL